VKIQEGEKMARQGNRMKITRVEVLVIAGLCLFLLAVLPIACRKAQTDAGQTLCARNLALLGQAMFAYANDYNGALPRAGGRNSEWSLLRYNWAAADRYNAYCVTPGTDEGGRASIGSCLYLLVKYGDVAPATFVCPTDPAGREFRLSEYAADRPDFALTDAWDFGPDPAKHYSYAYHIPFGRYPLKTSDDPGLALLADRNPWSMGKPAQHFKPDIPPHNGTAEQAAAGNTISHDEAGQNVLFLDGHVAFHDRPHCGLDNDNIYTVSAVPEHGDPMGKFPTIGGGLSSANARDSLLVQDPTPYTYRATTTRQAMSVDSNDLKQTTVLATLDCPVPSGRNAIWCATFQMAWDQYKGKILGEPIVVTGAEELAGRLNGAPFPTDDIEEETYYATAGAVDDGILEEIQREMARRFPTASPPVFDRRYRTLPDVVVAYAYLGLDMVFEHPFRANERPFAFTGSDGTKTDATSFSDYGEGDKEAVQVREQVEILHYGYGDKRDNASFAVDLCKHTQPYQIILARMPVASTLRETVATVEQAISAFKDDPDYDTLRRLRPIDRLTVPDVLYKLTHHFRELEDKDLGNAHLKDTFIFEALQTIDFSLSRTGVILRSAGYIASASRSAQIEKPRYLYFDRPFLIYVKKRQPEAQPFFVMWVDNAELLKPY
jgi:prepilin-type processing-associated H-X9-DG protein